MPDELKGMFNKLPNPGSEEVEALFPEQNTHGGGKQFYGGVFGGSNHQEGNVIPKGDSGSASRFFYCAKASKKDRDEGLNGVMKPIAKNTGEAHNVATLGRETEYRNNHPTVKPTKLMQYLVRLVTPKGGTVLDPFMGSGSTGKACKLEGFDFIGFEKEEDYCKIAEARIKAAEPELRLAI